MEAEDSRKLASFSGNVASQQTIEAIGKQLVEMIKMNNKKEIKQFLDTNQIVDIAMITAIESPDHLHVRGRGYDNLSEEKGGGKKNSIPTYDTSQWSPVLFAVYYQRLEILKLLLTNYSSNVILSLRLPPVNHISDYIVPSSARP